MINEIDSKRIAIDAGIAIDSLQGIIQCANEGHLHENYLRGKVKMVQGCVRFMQSFCEEEGN